MADKKISALTAATTPLAGTEVLPIVQSGSTVKVANNDLRPKQIQSNATSGVLQVVGPAAAATRVMTVPDANFTAARTDAAQSFTGDQTLGTGNLIQGTAAKGVNFTANTPAAGMTSQLLNWYEEGTYTPTLSFVGGNTGITYNTGATYGNYTRVGNLVFVVGRITLTSKGTSTGKNRVSLPFTAGAQTQPGGANLIFGANFSGTTADQINMAAITSTATGSLGNIQTGTGLSDTDLTDTTTFIFSFCYFAA